jgi:hypothetical protein
MKGRLRILKSGIRLKGQEAGNKIFPTCCALHNWLLHADGLNKHWEYGVRSTWEGSLGSHKINDVNNNLPEAII